MHGPFGVFDQFIRHVGPRCIGRSAHLGADAVAVEGNLCKGKIAKIVFVQAAAAEYFDLAKPGFIENLPHGASLCRQITAVDAHADELFATTGHFSGDGDSVARAGESIVGVD